MVVALALSAVAGFSGSAAGVEFAVTLGPHVAAKSAGGRLYVFLSRCAGGEPRLGPDWFHPEPFFRLDVTKLKPGEPSIVADTAAGFPDRLSRLPPGRYQAQAVLADSIYAAEPGRGAGNLYSEVREIAVVAGDAKQIALVLDQAVSEPELPAAKWIEPIEIKSELLGKFHHREVIDRAAVVLPASYFTEPARRYPVLYVVPSFGGSYREAWRHFPAPPKAEAGEAEFIRVMLDGQCDWGHHVFADSATNGPRGESLIKELIPAVDRRFRTVAAANARFVAGHSSGGWSSLWLQVTYPQSFGGVWSSSPDPVDFRDFQGIDLYADPPQNVYKDSKGVRRPLARSGESPVLWFDAFGRMDDVLGRGGQLRSFEAVFSPTDSAGLPRRSWDRATGQIDPQVAKTWQAYDIRLKLERDWPRLEPLLRGKLNVTVGSLDTFYLDGAVVRLRDALQRLGSDARVTIVPGADHSTILTPEHFRAARREMSDAYRKAYPGALRAGALPKTLAFSFPTGYAGF